MGFIVKINLGTDFRRKRFGNASEVTFEAITDMIREAFGLHQFIATFRDAEGNPCSLSLQTLPGALDLSIDILRLAVREVTQVGGSPTAQMLPTIGVPPAKTTHRRRSQSAAASSRPLLHPAHQPKEAVLVPGWQLADRPAHLPSVGATPLAARRQGSTPPLARGFVPRPSGIARSDEGHDADLALALELSMDEQRSRAKAEMKAEEDLARAVSESSIEDVRGRTKAEMAANEDLARALAESDRLGRGGGNSLSTASPPDREQLLRRMCGPDGFRRELAREKCRRFLDGLGLKVIEAGSINYSECMQLMTNQCFYLALARSFLGPSALVKDIALAFKRIIEQRVLQEHPEWREMGHVGECEQAYADFLISTMKDRSTDFAEFAVVLVDSTTSSAEIFKGVQFDDAVKRDRSKATENLLLLWYIPGHYQTLGTSDEKGSKPLLTLESIIDSFDRQGIQYIESCG